MQGRGRGRGAAGATPSRGGFERKRSASTGSSSGSAAATKKTKFEAVFPVVTPAPSAGTRGGEGSDTPPEATSARRAPPSAWAEASAASSGFVAPAYPRGGRGAGRGDSSRGRASLQRDNRGRGREQSYAHPPANRGGRVAGGGRGNASGYGSGGERGGARGGRGGFDRGARGRGQYPRARTPPAAAAVDTAQRDEDDNSGNEGEAPGAVQRRGVPQPLKNQVITTETENGSEIPKKLNNKVFIDGLPYNYQPEPGQPSLEEELLQFVTTWKVGKALRLIKKPGQGFGFVVFKSPHSVQSAVRVLHGRKFLGRALRVEEPKLKDMEKMGEVSELKDIGKTSFQRQVLLSDLNKISQPEMLRELLRDLAPQLEQKLEMIKMTAKNRKAFLTFTTEADAESAVEFLNGLMLLGRRVAATKAAAPGTLPYSKHQVTPLPPRAAAAPAATAADNEEGGNDDEDDEEEEEDLVVPLGMTPPATATATAAKKSPAAAVTGKKAAASTSTSASAATAAATGKTSKYNLLDQGADEVYVGNLGEEITEEQLRQHFAGCGAIKECEVIVNPSTHLSSGIGRVKFALPAYAAYAQEHLHGSRLKGYTLQVDRGDESSAPLPDEHAVAGDEDVYDETAILRRYGVKDKEEYFKGTSLEKKKKEGKSNKKAKGGTRMRNDDDDDDDDDDLAENEVSDTTNSKKKQKKAAGKTALIPDEEDEAPLPFLDDSEEEEEHFYDADTVMVPAESSGKAVKRKAKGKKKASNDAGSAKKGKKPELKKKKQ